MIKRSNRFLICKWSIVSFTKAFSNSRSMIWKKYYNWRRRRKKSRNKKWKKTWKWFRRKKAETSKKEIEVEVTKAKDEKKTLQVQSEMPGLDEKPSEKSSESKTDDKKKELDIPSFLRNQSN